MLFEVPPNIIFDLANKKCRHNLVQQVRCQKQLKKCRSDHDRSWQIHYMFHRCFTSCALAGNTPFQSLQIAKSPELLQIHHARSRFLLRDLHRLGPETMGFFTHWALWQWCFDWWVGLNWFLIFLQFMIRILGESKIRLWLSSSSIKNGEIVRWIPLLCILYKLFFWGE